MGPLMPFMATLSRTPGCRSGGRRGGSRRTSAPRPVSAGCCDPGSYLVKSGHDMWNRLRYSVWAPAYDTIVGAAGFTTIRRLSIERLRIASGHRVLIIGAGTGL